MLLKISLLVAVLAGAAVLVMSHLQVAPKITGLQEELASTQSQLQTSQQAESNAKKEAAEARKQASELAATLDTTTNLLAETVRQLAVQERRANQNEADLNRTRTELTEAQRDLAAWRALTIPVDQVRSRLAELVEVRKASEALEEEKKVLIRNLNRVKDRLAIYEGEVQPPPALPPGLKGTVVAVDPKWDFVVLDIGGNQGLVERGEMLVSRDGKLVAKIRVTSVEPARAVANILPEWKQAEVMEGDIVLH
jgi:multidrug efflux pump subunit AcrA (membrane-fusion protein)